MDSQMISQGVAEAPQGGEHGPSGCRPCEEFDLVLSSHFEPTAGMQRFLTAMRQTGKVRRTISKNLHDAGLSKNAYWTWTHRHGEPFRVWVSKERAKIPVPPARIT